MTDVRSDGRIDFTGCVEAGEAKQADENVAGNFSKSAWGAMTSLAEDVWTYLPFLQCGFIPQTEKCAVSTRKLLLNMNRAPLALREISLQ